MTTDLSMVEAQSLLSELIQPTRQLVALAKIQILAPETPSKFDGVQEATRFALAQGFEPIDPVVVHPTVNTRGAVESAARHWSSVLAFQQALVELDGEGLAVAYHQRGLASPSQSYTTSVGGGGQSGGWNLDRFEHLQTRQVLKPEFGAGSNQGITADGNIFAITAGLELAHGEIKQAAVDTVECLRRGLFRPTAATLGKVAEGAWIKVGLAMSTHLSGSRGAALHDQMTDQFVSFAKKVNVVVDEYRTQEFSDVRSLGTVRIPEVQSIIVWTDVVRTARNAIHFGSGAHTVASYDSVAILVIGGATSLRKLYAIKNACDQLASQ
jgi:hypothetical protein